MIYIPVGFALCISFELVYLKYFQEIETLFHDDKNSRIIIILSPNLGSKRLFMYALVLFVVFLLFSYSSRHITHRLSLKGKKSGK